MGFPFSTIGEEYFHFDDAGLTFPNASKMISVAFLIHCPIAILTAFEVRLPFFLRKLEIKTGYESLHLFFRKHSSQWNRLQVLTPCTWDTYTIVLLEACPCRFIYI